MKRDLLKERLEIVNIGLKIFAEPLYQNGVNIIHVEWKPKPVRSSLVEAMLKKLINPIN